MNAVTLSKGKIVETVVGYGALTWFVYMLVVYLFCLPLLVTPVYAQGAADRGVQSALRLPSPQARKAVDWVSTAVVAGSLAYPCLVDRTWACAKTEAINVGSAVALAELTKLFVHRERPDHSDFKSFFSEHTELACVVTLGTNRWAICPAVAAMRIMADKHWSSDTAAGAGIAAAIRWGH